MAERDKNIGQTKKDPKDTEERRGHEVLCAYCHQEIKGTPIEKNGYLYCAEEHARLDEKHAPNV